MQNKQGFSFIEIVIVILLLGIVGGLVLPTFLGNKYKAFASWKRDFASFVQQGVMRALQTGLVHQLYIDFETRQVGLKVYNPAAKQADIHKKFVSVSTKAKSWKYTWLEGLYVKDVYLAGHKENPDSGALQKLWIYLMPDGNVQPVLINAVYQEHEGDLEQKLCIEIEQMVGKVVMHEAFKQP